MLLKHTKCIEFFPCVTIFFRNCVVSPGLNFQDAVGRFFFDALNKADQPFAVYDDARGLSF